jgi:serine/threonine-protein kinase
MNGPENWKSGDHVPVKESTSIRILDCIYPLHPDTGRALYKVHNKEDGLPYALKVFDLARNDGNQIKKEMLAQNKVLQRPDLFPRGRGYSEANGWGLLRMDWLEGTSLEAVFERSPEGPRDIALRLRVLQNLCRTVNLVHRSRLLHRDIKPANILLRDRRDPSRGVMLIDFGMASVRRQVEEGTPCWNAPEQAGNRFMNFNEGTDIYGIGQVGWWLLTGYPRTAYDNEDHTDWDYEGMGRLNDLLTNTPKGLNDVLGKALAYKPEQRYKSANQLSSALNEIIKRG